MELPAAARRLLLQQPAVTGYVGSKVHKHQLWDHVDQKGTRAIVVRMAGGWEQPDRVQTSQFPLLAVDCWADCSRGETGDKLAEDVVESFRWQEPFHAAKGDGFGWNFSGVPYRVEMGESAVVMAQYAVHLA